MYSYTEHRPYVFTEEGQEKVVDLIEFARAAIKKSGAVSAGHLLHKAGSGDSWKLMACCERLMELGYLCPCGGWNDRVAWQDGVYVAGRRLR